VRWEHSPVPEHSSFSLFFFEKKKEQMSHKGGIFSPSHTFYTRFLVSRGAYEKGACEYLRRLEKNTSFVQRKRKHRI